MILAIVVVAFGSFYFLHGAIRSIRSNTEFDMSYSMPRPKGSLYNFIFGLDGREIDRKEIDPFKDRMAAQKAKAEAAGVGKELPKIDPKKATPGVAKAAAPAATKKPEVKVNVVDAEPQSPLTAGEVAEQPLPNAGANPQGVVSAQGHGEAKKEADTMSAAQWRALILGQPTKENVMKLIAAFNDKEVESTTLYLIMNDLMQSSNTETQGLGLMIGQNIPSLKSFSIVSENYEKFDAATKKDADAYLMSYMQGSKLPILALALQSGDNQVVARAAQVMVAGLEQAKNGKNTNSNNREDSGRGVIAASTSKVYAQFISIFQGLVKSSDSTVAGLAQNALTQIQALSNT
jgi:hypothetical protein